MVAGCNQVLGIHGTHKPDAAADQLCDPLPFDPHRYYSIMGAGVGGYAWKPARQQCQLYGYDLAVIDANDSAEITNELTGAPVPFWLGVAYDGTQWNAIDTCTPELDLAPGPGPAVGQCLMQNSGGMVPTDCTLKSAGPTTPLSALCETPRPNPQCRELAMQRNYTLLTSTVTTPVTHDAGAQMCTAMGKHLVEIDSTDELNYLLAHAAQIVPAFWVGAVQSSGSWTSPTGCPPIFLWTGMPANPCVYYSANFAVICELNVAS